MSLLRHRAMDVIAESTLSALSPGAARAWFVSLTSCDSEPELNAFTSQPSVVRGDARSPIEVSVNAARIRSSSRRGAGATVEDAVRAGRTAVASSIDGWSLVGAGWGTGLPRP